MKFVHLVGLSVALGLAGTWAGAASAQQDCAAAAALLKQAETDFASLQRQKIKSAQCVFRSRSNEFSCEWAFPGDAFGAAEAASARLAQCVAERRDYKAVSGKRDEQAFRLEPDLSVVVQHPTLDPDGWKVKLRIVSAGAAR